MERIPLPDRFDELMAAHCDRKSLELVRRHSKTLHFTAGDGIFKEGAPADQLYVVRQGKAKVFSTCGPGSSRILRFARDGQVLGHRGIGLDFTYSVSATALAPTSVDLVPMPVFLAVLKANAAFSFHFMLFLAEELKRSEEQAKNLLNMGTRQRVAKALGATAHCFGFDADDEGLLAYTPSRQDLADYAGTTYESTIRAISELRRRKLIRTVGREIGILDGGELEKLMRG